MKIKRIEICGFKSFVDKTSISFPTRSRRSSGRTAAASRTSSTPSAGSWASSRRKHLRGRAMEDVIFSGSESRGPAGFAEVSLTFDSSSLPPARRRRRALGRRWTRRDHGHAPPVSRRQQRVPAQRRAVAPARRHRALPGHRRRHEGVRDHRAGPHRVHRVVAPGGSPRADRRGRGHHALQVEEEGRRAQDGFDAPEPAARHDIIGEIEGGCARCGGRRRRPSATSATSPS